MGPQECKMVDLIEKLKRHSRWIHRQVQRGDTDLGAWMHTLPELRALSRSLLIAEVKRKHALRLVARSLGSNSWAQLSEALLRRGEDRGALMHRNSCGAYWHIWCASYEEARAIRQEHGGFLFPYGRQYFVAEAPYVMHLGLDPKDSDWERIGRDWIAPGCEEAWARLAGQAIDTRLTWARDMAVRSVVEEASGGGAS